MEVLCVKDICDQHYLDSFVFIWVWNREKVVGMLCVWVCFVWMCGWEGVCMWVLVCWCVGMGVSAFVRVNTMRYGNN